MAWLLCQRVVEMFSFQLTQSGGKLVSCSEVIAASAGWDWGSCDQHPRAVGRFRFLWGLVWGQPCLVRHQVTSFLVKATTAVTPQACLAP